MNKILIIEDDYEVTENLRETLELEHFEVYSAINGQIGIDMATEIIPDLIICDITMPEKDGYQVLTELRANQPTFSIPLIFLTAKTEKSDQRHGMELGADDFITKPFESKEILAAVETRLKKSSQTKEYYENKLDELRKTITSAIPHEFRTPLNTILGFSQLLQQSYGEISKKEFSMMQDSIYEAGKRLLRLVINYTFFGRVMSLTTKDHEAQPDITKSVKADITDTVLKVADIYKRESDISIQVESAEIHIPEKYFIKIVEELTDNAFKFSQINTKVEVIGHVENNHYNLSIKNIGRGMTSEQISSIGAFLQFERKEFEQQGSGLGLSIVKKIVDLYNLSFTIDGVPQEYLIAKVRFPMMH